MMRPFAFGVLAAASVVIVATPAWAPQVGKSVVAASPEGIDTIMQTFPCKACMTAGDVTDVFALPTRVYGPAGVIMQVGGALGPVDDVPVPVVVGLRAIPKAIGLFNPFDKPIEIVVTTLASGAARTYQLGPSEIVTTECGDCRTELELSIETSGQPAFKASFDGGTIVVPEPSGGRWQLAALGSGD